MLTEKQIPVWIDAVHDRTGLWPYRDSGWIVDAPGERWNRVDDALVRGLRGLPGGSSLAQFLAETRGVRNKADLPHMTEPEILTWIDAHHARHHEWPDYYSGPIPEAPGETWMAVHSALREGLCGLASGSSLARSPMQQRGVRCTRLLPHLTIAQILAWADAHNARTGRWPTGGSGPIVFTDGETWNAVNSALVHGLRGLPGGSSLAKLLRAKGRLAAQSFTPARQTRA